MRTALQQFRDALEARGLQPEHIIADGVLHRCRTTQGGRKLNGSYLFHDDERPAGGFQAFDDGLGWETWSAKLPRRESTPAERKAQLARRKAQQEQRDGDTAARHAKAAMQAKAMWDNAWIAWNHPYLTAKGVSQHGLKRLHDKLLIPVKIDGVLTSLQTIDYAGAKLFLPGGKVVGGYHLLRSLHRSPGRIIIGEGYATCATIFEAAGGAVAVAFDCGNLMPVARSIRKTHPGAAIILAADDDWKTEGNPGLTKATAAAKAVGGRVIVPTFAPGRTKGDTDFNDMARMKGLRAVREALNAAIA